MCGIVGFVGKENALEYILEGLSGLEYRGYDSAGVAIFTEGKIKTVKTVGRVEELCKKVKEGGDFSSCVGIGHTRWATHGAATTENAHPHLSSDKKFALVHNGIIENYGEIKADLVKNGVAFKSETDTEVIVHLLAANYNGNLYETVKKTTERLCGSYALAIICADFPDRIIAVRQGSPVIVGTSEKGNIIASDIAAVSRYAKNIYRLKDQDICEITKQGVNFFENCPSPERIKRRTMPQEKGSFKHFMQKEIYEQPEVAKNLVEGKIKNGRVIFDELPNANQLFSGVNQINIIACGSAYHAGKVGCLLFEKLLKIKTKAEIASEFRHRHHPDQNCSLNIFISQSGETADTVRAAEELKSKGCKTLAIVNVRHSALTEIADYTLYTDAGQEISVATTKGYTSQIIMLYLFGLWAAEQLCPEINLYEKIKKTQALPERILRSLGTKEMVKGLAEKIWDKESVYFIGRNIDYAVAQEASLKLKEISYIHSEAYAAGELKHGSIALIEEGSVVIALCCNPSLRDKMLLSIKEVKSRGAFVIAVCSEEDTVIPAVADQTITLPISFSFGDAVCEIIPMQLLAYYVARRKGLDVDKPRNLAKSVTVE